MSYERDETILPTSDQWREPIEGSESDCKAERCKVVSRKHSNILGNQGNGHGNEFQNRELSSKNIRTAWIRRTIESPNKHVLKKDIGKGMVHPKPPAATRQRHIIQ